jgi:hypothetical protein
MLANSPGTLEVLGSSGPVSNSRTFTLGFSLSLDAITHPETRRNSADVINKSNQYVGTSMFQQKTIVMN